MRGVFFLTGRCKAEEMGWRREAHPEGGNAACCADGEMRSATVPKSSPDT